MISARARRILVTGCDGFVGRTVLRMMRDDAELAGWEAVPLPAGFDLLDERASRMLVRDSRPEAVLHLAAQSSVTAAFEDPAGTIRVNVLGTLNLLEALRAVAFAGPVVYVSSGEIYGAVSEADLPVKEDQLPEPRNPYAVSKLAADALCRQWARTERMHIVIARPFNHIGPGQSERFVVPALARQIAAVRRRDAPPVIDVGDIDITRDFTDVRDVARAYLLLLRHGNAGECYNVASGTETRIAHILDTLVELAGVKVSIRRDPARLRAAEQRRSVGDPGKLRRATGWEPRIALRDSLAVVLESVDREIAP